MEILGVRLDQWVDVGISIAIVVAALALGRWLTRWVLDRVLLRLTRREGWDLADVVVDALRPAGYLLVVAISLQIALRRLEYDLQQPPLSDVLFVLNFIVIFIFAWLLIGGLFHWYSDQVSPTTGTDLDQQLLPFFRRIALLFLGVIGLVVLFSHFEVNVSALVTTLGIGSLAIALAAQETLSDTISGFVIMVDRPFRIGDRIEIQDLGTRGDVVDIGLRSSRIRTLDNRMVVVPNSIIGKSLVVNHSYPNTHYRIHTDVGVAYGSDIDRVQEILQEAAQNVEGVLPDYPVEALFVEFGDSALVFRVRWWIDAYEDTRTQVARMNAVLYRALAGGGVVIPFPQRDVHHKFDGEHGQRLVALLGGNPPEGAGGQQAGPGPRKENP